MTVPSPCGWSIDPSVPGTPTGTPTIISNGPLPTPRSLAWSAMGAQLVSAGWGLAMAMSSALGLVEPPSGGGSWLAGAARALVRLSATARATPSPTARPPCKMCINYLFLYRATDSSHQVDDTLAWLMLPLRQHRRAPSD